MYSQCLGDVNEDYVVNVQDVVIMISAILYDDEIDYNVADINNMLKCDIHILH